MPSFLSLFARPSRLLVPAIALAAGLWTPSASAVAPKAPTNLRLAWTFGNLSASSLNRRYQLRWDDNSGDETGFRVQYRVGNTGPFTDYGNLAPNTTEVVIGDFPLPDQYIMQFQVTAFKYNGAKVESSASNVAQYIVTAASPALNTPGGLTAALINEGSLRLKWTDYSTTEWAYQIFHRKTVASGSPENAYTLLGNVGFYSDQAANVSANAEIVFRHGLIPGQEYQFVVRASRDGSNSSPTPRTGLDTAFNATPATVVIPSLSAPSLLTGGAVDDQQIVLSWKDNTDAETGYQIQHKGISETSWTNFTIVNPNTTYYQVTTGPGITLEWRVLAIYKATGATDVLSPPSNVVTISTLFPGPAGLTATTSGTSGAVNLVWQDTESETNFDIYSRIVGTTDWFYCQSMLADTTRATVTTRQEPDPASTGQFITTPLAIDAEHEFVIEARYAGTGAVSEKSNIAKAFARHGFTSRGYQPAKQEAVFTSYTMAVSNSGARTSWRVTGLPEGLSFNAETGVISGSPQVSGVFTCPMTVDYSSGPSATLPLVLRILPKSAGPIVLEGDTFPATTVGTAAKFSFPLASRFTDPDAEKAVKLLTSRGEINLVLYPSLTPETVNNFLGYVNNKAYDDVIFHRSVPTFVVQGGAYKRLTDYNAFSSIAKRPAPFNEPGISNVRGMVAAAKVGGNPDSATHDFFFNLEDNSLKTGIELDNQNGGFTCFARVAGNGMSVVDSMAALPIGVYKDYNSSGGTDATLDRRVTLDGSKAAFEEVPMNVSGTTAPTTMDATKTVAIESAREISPLSYEVVSENPAVATAVAVNGNLEFTGIAAGTTVVRVRALDLDGNYSGEITCPVTVVKGYKAPVITKHPVALAVLAGSKGSMTVTATGSSLTYQWRKNQVNIEGATTKTLSFTNIQAADTGSYDVLVSNETTTLASNPARLDLRSAPLIGSALPTEMVVELGKPLVIEATVAGAPAPTLTWLRDNKTVSGQKLAKLNIPATKLTDAGTYILRASNVAGKADSSAAAVVVVDKSSRVLITTPGKTAVLKAQAAGPGLFYRWFRNDEELIGDTSSLVGTQTATLTVKSLTLLNQGNFSCKVWRDGSTPVETGDWIVSVVVKPILANFVAADAYIGLDYNYFLPEAGPSNTTITAFAATGLPPGLKLNTATGQITGRPTLSGTYSPKVTLKNPAGSTTVTATLTVRSMPEAVVGTFTGPVDVKELTGMKGGRLDLTVTDNGLFSGKFLCGKDTYSFTGGLIQQVPGQVYTVGTATIPRKGLPSLLMQFTTIAPSGYSDSGSISGVLTDGTRYANFSAYRNVYNATWNSHEVFTGVFNIGLKVTGDAVNNAAFPQGSGYLTATSTKAGVMNMVGRLGDGTAVTASSSLGPLNQFLIYQTVYKNTGSVVGLGYLTSVDNSSTHYFSRVDGALLWNRDAQPLASERLYKEGFNSVPVTVIGRSFIVPSGNDPILLSLPNANGNAGLFFTQGGLAAASINPNVVLNVKNGEKNTNYATVYNDVNPAKVKITLSKTTGAFSGSFELSDPPLAPKRTATFAGVIVQQIPTVVAGRYGNSAEIPGVAGEGIGHFLLNQLPTEDPPTTLTTSKILSGNVRISPTPITILDQPDSVAVDPGANVSFTVVASAPGGTLTYQWRRNGVSLNTTQIPSAKTATLTLNSVAAANEGNYDVVITTNYSRVESQVALLELNKAVSNVVVTRTPATNPIPVGGSVTFTVTAQGSGPLSYRWRKNGTDINGDAATAATYTITNVTIDDAGTYSVRVSNPLTPGGEPSNGNSMTVANPITSVTMSRTPASTSVGVGAVVTFQITDVAGSAGPYTYQWYKGTDAISGATSSVYTINFANADHAGVYKVKVKNNATPDGVDSNEVSLAVTTDISNVVASRTPADSVVPTGTAVIFAVSVQGLNPTFQWRKGNEDIPGATSASYTINSVVPGDAANYTVRVSNATTPDGVLSNTVALGVQQPITTVGITKSVDQTDFTVGSTVEFTAHPDGTGDFVYRWYKNENEISNTGSYLLLTSMTESDSGSYRVVVSNESTPGGISSSSLSITVSPP